MHLKFHSYIQRFIIHDYIMLCAAALHFVAFVLTKYVVTNAEGGIHCEANPVAQSMMTSPVLAVVFHSLALSFILLGYLWLRRRYLKSGSRGKTILFNLFVFFVFFINAYDALNDLAFFLALVR